MKPTISPFMLMKLRHRFNKYINHPAQRVRAFSSKLRKCFWEHIDKILFIVFLFLVALAVGVIVSRSVEICLQELLGLNEKGKYEVLKALGFCIVGTLLVLQALAANKRAKAMEDATENTEEGQRQERLKNAIEHLGHKRDSVRMGGAYELFHLAKDTRDLRQTVMDILCAHIRWTTGEEKYKEKHKAKPSGEKRKAEPSKEIQSLLTLLFREKHNVFENCSINLQGSYLSGAKLFKARLKKADLRWAQLQRANLKEAQLQRANLWGAQLQGANLSKARLQGARFSKAQLQRANLKEAQMSGDFLTEAKSQGAILSKEQEDDAQFIEGVQEHNRRNA